MRRFAFRLVPVVCLLAFVEVGSSKSAYLLRATLRSQTVQNKRADAENLSRMSDRAMVRQYSRAGLLVLVPKRTRHYYTKFVPTDYSYLRPWSKLFLDTLSRQYHARFRKQLRVTSMVRTTNLQRKVAVRNSNAAAATGPRRSSHLTGATLDISKKGMTAAELAWMRLTLQSLKEKGHVYAIEEFRQPTFHIMVHKNYAGTAEAATRTAGSKSSS